MKHNGSNHTISLHPERSRHLRITCLGIACIIAVVLSFSIGRYGVSPLQVVRILLSKVFPLEQTWTKQMEIVVLNVRLPRILAAALIGAALAGCGCLLQGIFRNPMVSPDILGSSAGAGFGAALALFCSFSYAAVTASSFAFGLCAVLLACAAAARFKENPTLGLILAGIMVGSLFTAGTSFLKLVADPTNQLPAITYWLMGSLASIRMKDLVLLFPILLASSVPLYLLRWRMNLLTIGDAEARSMGVNTTALRAIVIVCTTIMTAACVAVSGMIGWVGLVIPHIARRAVGPDFRYQLPASMLTGATFLVLVDDLARVIATSEVPIGILTAFVGAPFFLFLIMKGGKEHA